MIEKTSMMNWWSHDDSSGKGVTSQVGVFPFI